MDMPIYKEHLEAVPDAAVPFLQSLHASIRPEDPTGNQVFDAMDIAKDKVQIENVPAQVALDEAARIGQQALDEYWAGIDG